MSESLELPGKCHVARLFPLPNVVFYPSVTLPLHIFEPRYRKMTADSLATDRLITMVLLRPGWEADYDGNPPLHSVGCIGRIIGEEKLEDGRYNMLLRGLARVRLVSEVVGPEPYRQARIELMEDESAPLAGLYSLASELLAQAKRWFCELGIASNQALQKLSSELPANMLSDVLAFALPLEMCFKQQLLEELSVLRRTELLAAYLKENHAPAQQPVKAEPKLFPPEFSSN